MDREALNKEIAGLQEDFPNLLIEINHLNYNVDYGHYLQVWEVNPKREKLQILKSVKVIDAAGNIRKSNIPVISDWLYQQRRAFSPSKRTSQSHIREDLHNITSGEMG